MTWAMFVKITEDNKDGLAQQAGWDNYNQMLKETGGIEGDGIGLMWLMDEELPEPRSQGNMETRTVLSVEYRRWSNGETVNYLSDPDLLMFVPTADPDTGYAPWERVEYELF